LTDDAEKAADLLDSFWGDNSENSYGDRLLNDWLLWANRFFENTGGANYQSVSLRSRQKDQLKAAPLSLVFECICPPRDQYR
jgi:hypothetical protein